MKCNPSVTWLIQVQEFEEAAFTAPLNKIVRVKTKFGWHLVQALSQRSVFFWFLIRGLFCDKVLGLHGLCFDLRRGFIPIQYVKEHLGVANSMKVSADLLQIRANLKAGAGIPG